MEEIDYNLKFIINAEQKEYFYGNNYINNLNNILINKYRKLKYQIKKSKITLIKNLKII